MSRSALPVKRSESKTFNRKDIVFVLLGAIIFSVCLCALGSIAFYSVIARILAPTDGETSANGNSAKGNLLTGVGGSVGHPSWSPDGNWIVYHTYDYGTSTYSIAKSNVNTHQSQDLTARGMDNFTPAWSRTGRIAFACSRKTWQICVMNADGTGVIQLTNASGPNIEPSWSPDSRKIAYTHDCDIYSMNADGTNTVALVRGVGGACNPNPSWSPDGRRIAFTADSPSAMYVMNADGTGIKRLTNSTDYDGNPSWSPSGDRLAFARAGQILMMRADGTGLVKITGSVIETQAYEPAWSPNGDRIAFKRWESFLKDSQGNIVGDTFSIFVIAAPRQ